MNVSNEKVLMSEAATLYYEKKHTQQEIAELMNLSRQTVSKLLNDAIKENIVEIKIHNPKNDCIQLEQQICKKFGIDRCVITGVTSKNDVIRKTMTVKAAVEYLLPLLQKGGLKIAMSWGRMIQELIASMPEMSTVGNTVFPLFGATDNQSSYFSSNELARGMADKISANIKYAWFPYMAESSEERELIKTLSYYKKTQELWDTADIAIMGVGNTEILEVFGRAFGYKEKHAVAVGDIGTHFFAENGEIIDLYENTLCASAKNLANVKQTIVIASGNDKVKAIKGALNTKLVNVLVTDEYTAKQILESC